MIDKFLKAKHWHIFLLIIGLPALLGLLMVFILVNGLHDASIDSILNYVYAYVLVSLVYVFCIYSWFWALGAGLQQYIPHQFRMNVNRFKLFIFVPLVYVISMLIGISICFTLVTKPSAFILVLILPLHLFSMFCTFYQFYFIAKTIKTAELQRETKFEDYVGEFFLLWFYPVGIFIIQPKVNRLISGRLKDNNSQPINRE